MKPVNWKRLWIITIVLVVLGHVAVYYFRVVNRMMWEMAGTASFYRDADSVEISPSEHVFAERLYVGNVGAFSNPKQKELYIPAHSWDVLIAREHTIDGHFYIAFTVDKEQIGSVVYHMTGHRLEEFHDGVCSADESAQLRAPGFLRKRNLGQHWDLTKVKNGKYFSEGYAHCVVDMDTGRVFVRFM